LRWPSVKRFDEGIDDPDDIILANIVVQLLRKKNALMRSAPTYRLTLLLLSALAPTTRRRLVVRFADRFTADHAQATLTSLSGFGCLFEDANNLLALVLPPSASGTARAAHSVGMHNAQNETGLQI